MLRIVVGAAFYLGIAIQAWAQPAAVLIIRHAEKPPNGNELSLQGRERAAALVPYFLETPEVLEFKTPAAIYAQSPKHQTSSLRPIETVQPLAAALKLTINETYHREQFGDMVKEILTNQQYMGHTVLICWEHKVIPEIAAAFGTENAPDDWPSDAFDRTWVITFKQGEKPKCVNLPQRLMFGDSKK